jgi:hypothetical protein
MENPAPWWGNLFLLFFALGWAIRAFLLPWEISKRTGRKFVYGQISSEDRKTMTPKEKSYLKLMNVCGLIGVIIFIAAAYVMFRTVLSGNWKPK